MPADAGVGAPTGTGGVGNGEYVRPRRSVVIRIARFLFASAALVYLFHSVPVGDVSAVLRQAQPAWMVGAFLAAMLVQVFMAKRLRILTDAYGLGFGTLDVLGINLATRFYGLFLPGGGATATAVRVVRLARGQRKYAESLAAVALDRVITTATMCLLGVIFGLIASRPGESVWLVVMALGFVGLGAPVLWLRAARSRMGGPRGVAVSAEVAGPQPAVATAGPAGRLRSLKRALSGASAVSGRGWVWVLGASLLGQLAGIVEYALAAGALGIDLGFIAVGWVRAVMLLAAVLPISVAGLGLREGAAMLMLPHYGVGKDAALALSLLVFALGHLGVGAVGGLIEAFRKGD